MVLCTAAAAPAPETSQSEAAPEPTEEQPSQAEETLEATEAKEQPVEKEEEVAEAEQEGKEEVPPAAKYSEATKPLAELPGTAAAAPLPEAVKEEEGGSNQGYIILSDASHSPRFFF